MKTRFMYFPTLTLLLGAGLFLFSAQSYLTSLTHSSHQVADTFESGPVAAQDPFVSREAPGEPHNVTSNDVVYHIHDGTTPDSELWVIVTEVVALWEGGHEEVILSESEGRRINMAALANVGELIGRADGQKTHCDALRVTFKFPKDS